MCSGTGTSRSIFYLFFSLAEIIGHTNLMQGHVLTCCPDLWVHRSRFQGAELLTPLQQKQHNIETLLLPKEGSEGQKVTVPTRALGDPPEPCGFQHRLAPEEKKRSFICWPARPCPSLSTEQTTTAEVELNQPVFSSALTYFLAQSCK